MLTKLHACHLLKYDNYHGKRDIDHFRKKIKNN